MNWNGNIFYVEAGDNITLEDMLNFINDTSVMEKDTSQGYPIYKFYGGATYDKIQINSGGTLTIGRANDETYHEELWFYPKGNYRASIYNMSGGNFNIYYNSVIDFDANAQHYGNGVTQFGAANFIGNESHGIIIKNMSAFSMTVEYESLYKYVDFYYETVAYTQCLTGQPYGFGATHTFDHCRFYNNAYGSSCFTINIAKLGGKSLQILNCEINTRNTNYTWNKDIELKGDTFNTTSGFHIQGASDGIMEVNDCTFNTGTDPYTFYIASKNLILWLRGVTAPANNYPAYAYDYYTGELWIQDDCNWQDWSYGAHFDRPIYKTRQRTISIKDQHGNELTGALISVNNEQYRTYTYEAGLEITEKYAKYNWDTGAWDDYTDTMSVVIDGYLPYVGDIEDNIILTKRAEGMQAIPCIKEIQIDNYIQ